MLESFLIFKKSVSNSNLCQFSYELWEIWIQWSENWWKRKFQIDHFEIGKLSDIPIFTRIWDALTAKYTLEATTWNTKRAQWAKYTQNQLIMVNNEYVILEEIGRGRGRGREGGGKKDKWHFPSTEWPFITSSLFPFFLYRLIWKDKQTSSVESCTSTTFPPVPGVPVPISPSLCQLPITAADDTPLVVVVVVRGDFIFLHKIQTCSWFSVSSNTGSQRGKMRTGVVEW